ncbi:hypothetical protein ACLQ2R_09370 [Streptosporangium sp. DT93]|uniref:hypothetical protein n=1 Tax=Streptosporangium sp. DT93 TaxID=3393428 RepID=UPI003CF1AC1C
MVTEPSTGFLGSGWTSESETSGSADPWPEDDEKPRGRIRTVLLAVVAVAVLLGGIVAGVRVLTGSEGPADCPPAGCATAASNRPVPADESADPGDTDTDPDGSGDAAPSEDPSEAGDETGEATPSPAPATTRRGDGATSEPRPTTTRRATRAPRGGEDTPEAREPSPTRKPEPGATTAEPLVNDDPGPVSTAVPTPVPSTTAPTVPEPVPSTDGSLERPAPLAGGAAITVGAEVVDRGTRTYTVRLVLAAEEGVDGLTVSVPVSGEVSSLEGAEWDQVGDDLVIESPAGLEAGGRLVVTYTARGDAGVPRSCRSDQGECAVA